MLAEAIKNCLEPSRRFDVIRDLLKSNKCTPDYNSRIAKLKNTLKSYSGMSKTVRQDLINLGFAIEEGKHYKLVYYGDRRYSTTLAKTPSDNKSGANSAADIIRTMF